MSSRSSNEASPARLPLGRVSGHRGRSGELTVRVSAGDAAPWAAVTEIWIETPNAAGDGRLYGVEAARSYRDRLVLKLAGIDDGDAAARLRGQSVLVPRESAPALPAGRWWAADLVGRAVLDEDGSLLGTVDDVQPTGGVDLLVVRRPAPREELLVPLADEIVLDVDDERREIRVRLPEGLADLDLEDGAE